MTDGGKDAIGDVMGGGDSAIAGAAGGADNAIAGATSGADNAIDDVAGGDDAIGGLVKIGAAAAALGVSVDTLRRWERAGKVSFERRGKLRYISSATLASLLRERSATGLSSARNKLSGIVVAVKRDEVMAQIDLACGPFRIVSLMSREAADELGLEPGMPATAVVKATTVIIETH